MYGFLIIGFFVVPLLSVFGVFLYLYSQNRFEVDHKARERLAIRSRWNGDIKILGPGTWYFPPWWEEHERVPVNKEPMLTEAHPALTADGQEVRISLRYNELTGRPFKKKNGQPRGEVTDVDDEVVLTSVTNITDFKDRKKYVADIINGVIDAVIGEFTMKELFNTEEITRQPGVTVYIPKRDHRKFELNHKEVSNRGDVLQAIGIYIQRLANYRLKDVGFTVDEVDVTDFRPKSDEVQRAMDRTFELERQTSAIKSIPDNMGLTSRAQFAVATDQYGQVAIAEAIRHVADKLMGTEDTNKN